MPEDRTPASKPSPPPKPGPPPGGRGPRPGPPPGGQGARPGPPPGGRPAVPQGAPGRRDGRPAVAADHRQRRDAGAAAHGAAGNPAPTTAPYTFVPFAPTVAARSLTGPELADPAGSPIAASAFDRPLSGTHTGHVDLTITALSPLFVGGDPDGATFRWPGTAPGVAGIPGSSLHGMLRGTLAHVLGGGIGPVPDRRIFFRSPIAPGRDDRDPVYDNYKARNPGGVLGGQRIGLLYRGDNGGYRIDECVQFTGRGRSNVVPRVRWAVLEADLGISREGSRSDSQADVFALQWSRMWVVWAAVGQPGEDAVRPVVVGVGRTADDAARAASARIDTGRVRDCLAPPRAPRRPSEFRHFLAARGYRTGAPEPVQMVFTATGLEGLTSIASAHLFPIPGSDIEYLIDSEERFYDTGEPLEVARSAVGDLLAGDQPTRYQRDNWPPAKDFLHTKPDGPDGIPVFFSADDDGAVTYVGRSGGFRIPAKRTVLDTVPAAHRSPGPEIPALHALFGHQPVADDDAVPAMAGRIEVGHARAVADPGTLPTATVTLLEPKVSAWRFRLQRKDGPVEIGYDDPAAAYRGREVYHHRWPKAGDDATTWRTVTDRRAESQDAELQDAGPREDEAAEDKVSGPKSPLRSGARFTARIRFTNLAPAELGALLFAIRLGNARRPDGLTRDFGHKIGGMKPLGLGSVHLDATTSVVGPDRHRSWDAPAVVPFEDENACIQAFLDAVGAAEAGATTGWVWVAETGRHWPEHIAALLLSARWTGRLPVDSTREMTLAEHADATVLPDVFTIHPDARRYPDR